MKKNWKLYYIKPEDTLASIAFRLNMTEEQVKDFHNSNCWEARILWFDYFEYMEKLIIPINKVSEEQNTKKLERLLPSKEYLISIHHPKYLVTETLVSQENETQISYLINIHFPDTNNPNLVTVKAEHFKKNNKRIGHKIDGISIACLEAASPLLFSLTEKGNIEELKNHKEILENFKTHRKDIENFHIGEVTKEYLDHVEESLSIENEVQRQLRSTLLYQVLFPKSTWFHRFSPWKERFVVKLKTSPVAFNCTTEHRDISYSVIETRLACQEADSDHPHWINISYQTDTLTKKLNEIDAKISSSENDEIHVQHKIHLKAI